MEQLSCPQSFQAFTPGVLRFLRSQKTEIRPVWKSGIPFQSRVSRCSVGLGIILSFFTLTSSVDANFCRGFVAAAALLNSTTFAAPGRDIRWPYNEYQYLSRTNVTPDTASIYEQINAAHEIYRDRVFFEGPDSAYDPRFFPADQFLNSTDSPWVAVEGGWKTVTLTAPAQMPWQHRWGREVIYDNLLNDPNLFQYTVIDWSQFPYRLTLTHYAWVKTDRSLPLVFDSANAHESPSINLVPSPGNAFLIGVGTLLIASRPTLKKR